MAEFICNAKLTNFSFLCHQTPKQFHSKFLQLAQAKNLNDSDYKGFAYDAAWLVALALNKTDQNLGPNVSLDSLPFGDKNFSDFMKGNLLSTEFQGMTVSVAFIS